MGEHNNTHDLIILSDLHMGRGINPDTRRFYTLENFFYDGDFARFCDFLCREAASRERPFRLIFNGDTFDLLRIDPLEPLEGASKQDRRFGPAHTPQQAARTVQEIMAGHPNFVRGIAQILNAGHLVIFLPGNHDIEMQWAPVQEEVRRSISSQLRARYGEPAEAAALPLLSFRSWFYYEPQRIWIEHGCQYDPENSFRFLMRDNLAEGADTLHEMEQDMPLGNFFQRYLYNAFGHITFIVPSTRANLRYVKWLLLNEPRLLVKVILGHGPFVYQVLKRISQEGKDETRQRLRESHEASLSQAAATSGLGPKLLAIDGLKEIRADAVQAMRSLSWQAIKGLFTCLTVVGLCLALWFTGIVIISHLVWGSVVKAICLSLFTVGGASSIILCIIYSLLGDSAAISPRPLRRAAQKIADILDVPMVSFGHSHDEEICKLTRAGQEPGWYCNTGTWIAVFTHDVLIPRERVQYTFLRVRGTQGSLMHWSPGRGEPVDVVLLDEGDLAPPAT